MAKIRVTDLPKDKRISKAELKAITAGGLVSSPLGFMGAFREPLSGLAPGFNPMWNTAGVSDPGGEPPGPNLGARDARGL